MTSTIEYLALTAVAIVLVISLVQAAQLSGLNEKTLEQNTVLTSIMASGINNNNAAQANQTTQNMAQQQTTPAPSQQMVGGC